MSARRTRREFLKAAGAGAAWITLLNTLGCEPAKQKARKTRQARKTGHSSQHKYVQTFRSRPDLSPPTVEVTVQPQDTAPGYIFIAPKKGPGQDGSMIIDDLGQLVWFRKDGYLGEGGYAMDFKAQRYQGRPVLTWWEGKIVKGHGVGEYLIFDSSYQEITRVRAGNGYQGDLHEFHITPQDTALITIYEETRRDLSSVGGPEDGEVVEGIAQEVDIETGEVLFEWHSFDHADFSESYSKPDFFLDKGKPFDYFHINSIDIDHDDNLLISARNTSTVYKVDRETGEVMWRLGGKKSDFEMGPGTRFAHQHDARRQPDGTITILDNGSHPWAENEESRGIVVELDMDEMTASLVREYTFPDKLRASSQANMQVLPNDNVFIGWGRKPLFSEFSNDGELLFNAIFPGRCQTYRAFRFPWNGQPNEDPAVAAEPGSNDEVTVYASWNGATEVATWQVLAGPNPGRLKSVGSAPREGFETAIAVRTTEPYVAVQAEHRSGQVLGTSKAIKPGDKAV